MALAAAARAFEAKTGRKFAIHIWGCTQAGVEPEMFVELTDETFEVRSTAASLLVSCLLVVSCCRTLRERPSLFSGHLVRGQRAAVSTITLGVGSKVE